MPREIDPTFLELPRHSLADAALQRARELGASHADFRLERIRGQRIQLRDGRVEGTADDEDCGFAVRVVLDGTWGFAAAADLTPEAAVAAAELAVQVAKVSSAINSERVELADEPVYRDLTSISAYEVDPFDVPDPDKIGLLADRSARLLAHSNVDHVDAVSYAVKENKFYADLAGTVTTQQRLRVHPEITATAVDKDSGRFETMRTLAQPAGRGWEWLVGSSGGAYVGSPGSAGGGAVPALWDWDRELEEIPESLAEKMVAPSVEPGDYDLVIDPTNLWLTIHESVGHATELDRALGYEAAYAGTSFATFDKLGSLRYGSKLMNVTGDRTATHGLATIGWDDDGVETRQWDIVRDGVLVGYQLDRRMAQLKGLGRSNGCAFADSPSHMPIQRMANVSLRPAADGPSTDELIAGVERGIYILGDKSWSIDMQRYNFQFTGQRFYRIEGGRLAGQLRDVAYQATTTDFWGSMGAVGGPQTYVLGGAFNCGKGQPGQVAAVSHGCPAAVFNGVRILNAVQEAGR
jgi:TldD protein